MDTIGSDWCVSTFSLVQATSLVAIEVASGITTIAPLAANNLGVTPADKSNFLLLVPCLFLIVFQDAHVPNFQDGCFI